MRVQVVAALAVLFVSVEAWKLGHDVKVGGKVPSVDLHKGFPPEKVSTADLTKGKKVVFVGLPGAYTPT